METKKETIQLTVYFLYMLEEVLKYASCNDILELSKIDNSIAKKFNFNDEEAFKYWKEEIMKMLGEVKGDNHTFVFNNKELGVLEDALAIYEYPEVIKSISGGEEEIEISRNMRDRIGEYMKNMWIHTLSQTAIIEYEEANAEGENVAIEIKKLKELRIKNRKVKTEAKNKIAEIEKEIEEVSERINKISERINKS